MTIANQEAIQNIQKRLDANFTPRAEDVELLLKTVNALRTRKPGWFCDACFTSSFEPCPEDYPFAIPDPGRPGQFMNCAMCQAVTFLNKQRLVITSMLMALGDPNFECKENTCESCNADLRAAIDIGMKHLGYQSYLKFLEAESGIKVS